MSQIANHLTFQVRKKLGLAHRLSELDPRLSAKESLFRSPPMTPELLAAIKLISPQFRLRADEASRIFWEKNQNGACWGEYEKLKPFLDRLGTPAKVLDIGPGLGRSVVFFKKARGWDTVPFHLFEGSGTSTKYTQAGPRFEDSFCGTPDMLMSLLDFNGVRHCELFDANKMGARLAGLPGPYDFIYSFFAIGFHWSIEHFLDELLALMSDRAIGAFTLHNRFKDLSSLRRVPHRVVRFDGCWPRGKSWRMLVMSKSEGALGPAAA